MYKNVDFRATYDKLVNEPDGVWAKRPACFLPDLKSTFAKGTNYWCQQNSTGQDHGVSWNLFSDGLIIRRQKNDSLHGQRCFIMKDGFTQAEYWKHNR